MRLGDIKPIERNRFAVEGQRRRGQRRPPTVSTVFVWPEWPRSGKHRPRRPGTRGLRCVCLPLTQDAGWRSIHISKRYANPPASFVQRDFFTHRGIARCLSPTRRRDSRKSPLHSRTPGRGGPTRGHVTARMNTQSRRNAGGREGIWPRGWGRSCRSRRHERGYGRSWTERGHALGPGSAL